MKCETSDVAGNLEDILFKFHRRGGLFIIMFSPFNCQNLLNLTVSSTVFILRSGASITLDDDDVEALCLLVAVIRALIVGVVFHNNNLIDLIISLLRWCV